MDINSAPRRTDLQEAIRRCSDAICKNNVTAVLEILSNNPDQRLAQHALLLSIHRHCVPVIRVLVEHHFSKDYFSSCLAAAVDRGLIDAVDLLLPKSDVTYNKCEPLCNAASLGRQDIFDCLLAQWSAPYEHITSVASAAARLGHLHIVKQCMELAPVDPAPVLMSASMRGYLAVMQLVLPQCAPVDCVHTIFVADRYKCPDAVDLLWPIVQHYPNWEALAIDPHHQFDPSKSHLARLKQTMDERQELNAALNQSAPAYSKTKKI